MYRVFLSPKPASTESSQQLPSAMAAVVGAACSVYVLKYVHMYSRYRTQTSRVYMCGSNLASRNSSISPYTTAASTDQPINHGTPFIMNAHYIAIMLRRFGYIGKVPKTGSRRLCMVYFKRTWHLLWSHSRAEKSPIEHKLMSSDSLLFFFPCLCSPFSLPSSKIILCYIYKSIG